MKRLFVLQHIECEPLGIWAEELKRWHVRVDVIESWKHATLPDPEDTLAVIALGGPMNVGEVDRYPFLADEIRYLAETVTRSIPMLGVCLGAQLLAHTLGAQVQPGPRPEIGYQTVVLTPEGAEDRLLAGFPMELPVFQWHAQGLELPSGAVRLAGSEAYPNQAFRKDAVWGFQFHLETTPDMVADWCRVYRNDLAAAGVTPEQIAEQAGLSGRMAGLYGRQVIRRFWDTVTESLLT